MVLNQVMLINNVTFIYISDRGHHFEIYVWENSVPLYSSRSFRYRNWTNILVWLNKMQIVKTGTNYCIYKITLVKHFCLIFTYVLSLNACQF